MSNIIKVFAIIVTVLFSTILTPFQIKAAPPSDFQSSQIIGSGLSNPTAFDIAPDGRIFIIEQKGRVLIYKNGQLLAQPFATLPTSQSGGDLGLLGIAFDPDFLSNHYVYFYYTSTGSRNTIVRYDATNDTASGSPLLIYESNDITQVYHAGGTIQFGTDGKLYLSIGDNGYPPNGQDLSNSLGKIHRINKDGSVPTDNPFYGQNNRLNTIWAYGFRNPFRFQIDKTNGKLYVGDVGEQTWEEINQVVKGANYGWPTCEGTCINGGMTNPYYAYNHNGNSASVSGGFVYHGNMFPSSYQNAYFFADYAQGFIKNLFVNGSGTIIGVNNFDLNAGTVVDLKQANDGSFYYLTIFPGRLHRVTYNVSNHVPTAIASSNIQSGPTPLTINFSSSGSNDLDGDPLTFFWNFGDGTTSTQANPIKTYTTKGKFTVLLTVSDGGNQSQATPILIQAGTPPNLIITSPINNSLYKAGDLISYSATGTDSNGQSLGDSSFTTEIIFHHDTHTHPFLGPLIGSRAGQFTVPNSGENSTHVYYEVRVILTDHNGLTTTKSVNINPLIVNLNFVTSPANLKVLLDSQLVSTPESTPSVAGLKREINVPPIQLLNGTYYQFDSWSDGGALKHFITTPNSNSTITANLKPTPAFNATYFNNVNLTGNPVLTRNEGMIDYDFGGGSPAPSVNSDNFSIRFVKQHYFHQGSYKFETLSDDGVRLFIDNVAIIDKWVDQGSTLHTATVSLTEGNHEIKFEYYERGGGANVKLLWDMVTGEEIPPTTGQSVSSFSLVNADSNQVISTFDPLINGATLNLQTLPTRNLNIRANTNPAVVGSVRFGYDGNSNFGTETNTPYALASDNNGDYLPWTPGVGTHTITATPYTNSGGSGTAGTPLSITINIQDQALGSPTPTPNGQSIASYTLINADTDQPISGFNPISPNATLNLQTLPTRNLNIRANTNPAVVGSVRFGYDGNSNFGYENNSPYALASDDNGNYFPWTPSLGSHTITATPYTGSNLGGIAGTPLSLVINIIDQNSPTPTSGGSPTPSPVPTSTPTGISVASFSLVNADTDQVITNYSSIQNGAVISLSSLPTTRLNIIANTNPEFIGSVRFGYDGNGNFQTENIPPYALAGDDGGDYVSWTPSVGTHTITATPYTNQNGGGTVGTSLSITFTISN